MTKIRRRVLSGLSLGALACGMTLTAQTSNAAKSVSLCEDVPHGDHPRKLLSNGKLDVLVFLPDAKNGYYRSTRFDWSGVVGCASLNGHRFFGEWFSGYDPMKNDSITGPVEEFRTVGGPIGHTGPKGELVVPPGAIGYAEAKPGETFLKPGVGVLRKVDDKPYAFGFAYPIVDTGKWTVSSTKRSITFRQVLNGPDGYAYVYEKTLSLDKDGSAMTLDHRLKNTGKKTIDTSVYDHDFFMMDGKPTGPGHVVRFAFEPKPEDPIGSAAKIEGKNLVYVEPLAPRNGVQGYLTGYSDKASDFDFTVEDTNSGVSIRQTADHPLARLYFWSTRTTICPEGYIHLNIPPGETGTWKLRYQFTAPAK
ncbi:MAG TPA: hypothetical protein VK593_04760 [Edaphobacter sp.]|nr:hypothetical protein [Edaphobacter sp.]